jgi:hypothetical protein
VWSEATTYVVTLDARHAPYLDLELYAGVPGLQGADNGDRGGPTVGGLGADGLNDVLSPCVFAILATCSWATFSLNHLACVIVAFSHAMASFWLALMVIMPLGPDIFSVA